MVDCLIYLHFLLSLIHPNHLTIRNAYLTFYVRFYFTFHHWPNIRFRNGNKTFLCELSICKCLKPTRFQALSENWIGFDRARVLIESLNIVFTKSAFSFAEITSLTPWINCMWSNSSCFHSFDISFWPFRSCRSNT